MLLANRSHSVSPSKCRFAAVLAVGRTDGGISSIGRYTNNAYRTGAQVHKLGVTAGMQRAPLSSSPFPMLSSLSLRTSRLAPMCMR
jgi:hypothetical protein